jgi:hypothetical protein
MSAKKKALPLRAMHQALTDAAELIQSPLAHTLTAAGTDYLYQRAQEALACKQPQLAVVLIAYALVRDDTAKPVQSDTTVSN